MTKNNKKATNKVMSIDELKELSTPLVQIPGFDTGETIFVRLRKPQLMKMLAAGKIPNHLLGIANTLVAGKKPLAEEEEADQEEEMKMIVDTMDLFVQACLVEPTYEEFKDIITDDQKGFIMEWAMGTAGQLDSFRNDNPDDDDDKHGEEVPDDTK